MQYLTFLLTDLFLPSCLLRYFLALLFKKKCQCQLWGKIQWPNCYSNAKKFRFNSASRCSAEKREYQTWSDFLQGCTIRHGRLWASRLSFNKVKSWKKKKRKRKITSILVWNHMDSLELICWLAPINYDQRCILNLTIATPGSNHSLPISEMNRVGGEEIKKQSHH